MVIDQGFLRESESLETIVLLTMGSMFVNVLDRDPVVFGDRAFLTSWHKTKSMANGWRGSGGLYTRIFHHAVKHLSINPIFG